jgi:hypothetical protein
MRTVWFIGEAPRPATSRPGRASRVEESGRQLAQWADLSMAEFQARATLRNLYDEQPDTWSREGARLRASGPLLAEVLGSSLRHNEPPLVVLLGEKVREAWCGSAVTRWSPYAVQSAYHHFIAWMPHPSAVNPHWKDEANVRRAERFLHRVLAVTKEGAMGETQTKPTKAPVKKPMGPKTKPGPKRPGVAK